MPPSAKDNYIDCCILRHCAKPTILIVASCAKAICCHRNKANCIDCVSCAITLSQLFWLLHLMSRPFTAIVQNPPILIVVSCVIFFWLPQFHRMLHRYLSFGRCDSPIAAPYFFGRHNPPIATPQFFFWPARSLDCQAALWR